MDNNFSYYTKYRQHIPQYNNWVKSNNKKSVIAQSSLLNGCDKGKIEQKAKLIIEPLFLQDIYEHEKAEDAETFYQTLNIELISIAALIASIPSAIKGAIPLLNKYAKDGNLAQKASEILKEYSKKAIKAGSKNIPLSKVLTIISSALGMAFFAKGIKKSMQSQLGLIRKASFDGTKSIINDPKMFAELTKEQEQEVNSIINLENKNNNIIVDKLQDKISLTSTFESVNEYNQTKQNYLKEKEEYFNDIDANSKKRAYKYQMDNAKEDKILFENLLKNVEHGVLERLRKVETVANIAYSSIFMGGFLEYLLTDKLVQVLGVKNKIAAMAVKIAAPLITYLLLNKNISDIENKAILATKYKYMKEFAQTPLITKKEEKQNIFELLKSVYKDMKDYDKFSKDELPLIKKRLEAKRRINLNQEQEKKAKALQRNTAMVINKHRDEVYNQTVGIKALSESILGPIDIISTAMGAIIGNGIAKATGKTQNLRLFKGIGALVMFIPAAIIEAKLTKQQKLAEKIAAMNTIKDLQNEKLFVYHSSEDDRQIKMPDAMQEFQNHINK